MGLYTWAVQSHFFLYDAPSMFYFAYLQLWLLQTGAELVSNVLLCFCSPMP